jgi:hypothetical protein
VERLDQARLERSRERLIHRAQLPVPAELRERWQSMTAEHRREAIAGLIECVFVHRGRKRPRERLAVCLRGRAPHGLPPFNLRQPVQTKPFDPAECSPTASLQKEPEWTETQLRETLEPFLNQRTQWPSFPDFQAAGLGLVYMQVEHHGGPRRWAKLLGMPYAPPGAEIDVWPDERIRKELSAFVGGASIWPAYNEFTRARKLRLRRAIKWTGGPERWAEEIGVRLPPNRWEVEHWSYARIREGVATFTADRSDFPARPEFYAAGLGRLYQAIHRAHVRDRLSVELGLALPPGRKILKKVRWTEPAIKTALDELVIGRTTWPSRRDFKGAGLGGLDEALQRSGTRQAWADRYGLPVQRRRPRPGWPEYVATA